MKSYIAENLIKARAYYNWTQGQAAEMIGIKRSTYAAYEERRSEPPLDTLLSICKAFGVIDIPDFISSEKFNIAQQNGSSIIQDSFIEKQYSKLTGKDKIAVNALLEI